jgi:ribulose-5-phosphate 4-epimerase/fuculose-1-phosphate aldolase
MSAHVHNIRSADHISETERAIRVDLAACYRLVALYGWDDLIFTHISARIPSPEHHFLINPYGMMFEEITASSLVKIGLDGKPVGDSPFPVNPAGFTIHSAVHEAREDAGCVMHLHTPDGTAVATSSERLLPLNQTAQLVIPDLAYHDYEGVALDHDERPRLQKDLGTKNAMLLHNHGTLTVGKTCGEAFLRMYFLERSCTMQVRTRMLGGIESDYPTRPDVIEKNAALAKSGGLSMLAQQLVWPALLRKLDRTDPSFRN